MPTRGLDLESFRSIREWEGRKTRSFEELCFQLRDPTPSGAELIKTGDPDAGVEWYWRHPDGREEGWQAKFVFDTDGLLAQMRDSLKSAAEKRPGLRRMTFCIPIDLADDPSGARGKQARQRYEEALTRWREFAPEVEVDLLSGGELLERLNEERHRGREFFFFGERLLGAEWCRRELDATIEDAGDRYTPEQDVALPIDETLAAVALPDWLAKRLEERRDAVVLAARSLLDSPGEKGPWAPRLEAVGEAVVELERVALACPQPPAIERPPIGALVERLRDEIEGLESELLPHMAAARQGTVGESGDVPKQMLEEKRRRLGDAAASAEHKLRELSRDLHRFEGLVDSKMVRAAEKAAIFVEGAAGRGKTHLFCDVAERLADAGHPVIVLLGERFHGGSPWRTVAELLGEPNLSPEEIATVLAASGEASGRRAVLLIDAINETSPDPEIWRSELSDMRRRLTASGWVGLGVSCRDTYLDLVEPKGGRDENFTRVEHLGYRGREHEATERIFAVHGLAPPRVPLLLDEFTDPLFLKLYCEGFKGSGAPSGSEHLSAVFTAFVEARAGVVESKLRLDPGLETVRRAMAAFATRLVERGEERLPYMEAAQLINGFAPGKDESPNTLIEQMASEGLLARDRVLLEAVGERGEAVGFPYQRFSDHLIVGAFLDRHLAGASGEQLGAAFAPGTELQRWLEDAPKGFLEAVAVQLPERWGVELADLQEATAEDDEDGWLRNHFVLPHFLASLIARRRDAFGERSTALIDECLNAVPEETIDALIAIAADPEHPYNAIRLHSFLASMSMAERDAYWGIETFESFGDPSRSLDRVIRWAARGPHPDFKDTVIELACLPVIWQLGSPNRFARDYATKALASVLIDRVELCGALIERFAAVDDPYVKQRLAAAVLGAVTRGGPENFTAEQMNSLLETMVEELIESECALPDILTRDHIASLARWARRHKLIPPRLLKRALPPYGSEPPATPPRTEELESEYPAGEDGEGYRELHFSALSTHSDWSRYAVSGRIDDFSRRPLGQPSNESEQLTEIDGVGWAKFLAALRPEQLRHLEGENPDVDSLIDDLDTEQAELLGSVAITNVPASGHLREQAVSLEEAGRLIFSRAVELGWTPERFGEFDRMIARRNMVRESHKAERFGKKYQWIALHELLARLADNFTMQVWGGDTQYEGGWQLGTLRDLDPTLPPEKIAITGNWEHSRSPTFAFDRPPIWWSQWSPRFDPSLAGCEGEWAEQVEDMPSPERLLRVRDSEGRRWMIIDSHQNWREDPEEMPSLNVPDSPRRDLWIRSASTVIRQRSLAKLRRQIKGDPDLLRSLPDWNHNDMHGALWAELPDEEGRHERQVGWRRAGEEGRMKVPSAATCLGYGAEDVGYDCSLSSGISVDLPSSFLAELLGIHWEERAGGWVDARGTVVVRFRQSDEGFHRDRALMVEETALRTALAEKKLVLAIGLLSERRVFDRKKSFSDLKMLGWTDYAGHLLIEGDSIHEQSFVAIKRHHEPEPEADAGVEPETE